MDSILTANRRLIQGILSTKPVMKHVYCLSVNTAGDMKVKAG